MGGMDMVNEKHYYKSVQNGFIDSVGYGYGFPEITEEEYQMLREMILSAPEAPEGYVNQLTEDLQWQQIKIEQEAMSNGSTEV